jgi:hypothetical protein
VRNAQPIKSMMELFAGSSLSSVGNLIRRVQPRSATLRLLKVESGINGILPAGGGPLPTSEVIRQVGEREEFLFARA